MKKGFTLIELLVVIAILASLAVTVFVALNPSLRLKQAQDARRSTDVDSILSAIHEYIVDHQGSLPTNLSAIGATETQIGTSTTACNGTIGTCTIVPTGCVDLSPASTAGVGNYLKTIPYDPNGGSETKTNYSVTYDSTNGFVTVKACNSAVTTPPVSATR